ncbi:MAG: hypothetical protein HY321_13200 [Armatimonadetes bacterium]|nr:hypothetical protein [Armatimonadota bacterium]
MNRDPNQWRRAGTGPDAHNPQGVPLAPEDVPAARESVAAEDRRAAETGTDVSGTGEAAAALGAPDRDDRAPGTEGGAEPTGTPHPEAAAPPTRRDLEGARVRGPGDELDPFEVFLGVDRHDLVPDEEEGSAPAGGIGNVERRRPERKA